MLFGSSGLYALNPDLSQGWYRSLGQNVSGSVVPNFDTDGNIYVGTNYTGTTGMLHKLSATGTVQWTFSPPLAPSAVQYSAVIDGQGRVYVGSTNKYIYALNPIDGTVIWEYQLTDYAVGFAIANGRVYVAGHDGKLYSFGE